jgi:hypothetical protein
MVPDGRIFGQLTQKRPQKIVYGRKKLEAEKGRIWQKVAEKKKIFLQTNRGKII